MATEAEPIPYLDGGGDRAVVNLTSEQSWSDGDEFRLEAQGGEVRLYEGSAAPDLTMDPAYIRLVASEVYWHSQGASDNLYAWTIDRSGARLSINDAE